MRTVPSDDRLTMTPEAYKALRESVGSQTEVCKLIPGLAQTTLSRRENGHLPIDTEAEYALRYLAECREREAT